MSLLNLVDKLRNLQRVMRKREIDAAIAASPVNVYYSTNFRSHLRSRTGAIAVVPLDRDPILIVPAGYLDLCIDSNNGAGDIRSYGKFSFADGVSSSKVDSKGDMAMRNLISRNQERGGAAEILTNVIKEVGARKVGLEVSESILDLGSALRSSLPDVELVPGSKLFEQARARKTPSEIEVIGRSARIAQTAIEDSLGSVHEGISEKEIYEKFATSIVSAGATPFVSIGCGTHSAFPNARPTDYRLRKGDIIRFDGGCVYEGYNSDISAIGVLGRPSQRTSELYHALEAGAEMAVARMEVGTRLSDVFNVALDGVRKQGVPAYQRHHIGHSIGLEVFENPVINADSSTEIEEEMVFSVETPYYKLGYGGLQVEYMIAVRKNGVQCLSDIGKELIVV